ncbi:MAG: hypothetical protein NTY02_19725, partial [Acidobacteria bacterium]|nr:hypothetical protein [Acidobacteriota bacterium]
VLYLCSSPFIAPNEVGFVRRWVQAIRASDDPVVRTVNVLIRPHPQNAEQWVGVDLADMPGAALWPKGGANPIDELARSDYYHSMHFSAAVVGVNTSAQVESSILGRPVLTVLSPDFSQTQEGTLHFQHLNSGLLRVGKDLDEHVGQLAEILRNPGVPDARSQAFVASFVRPHGRDVPATGLFVDAIEHLAARESAGTPVPVPLSAAVVRTLSLPAAALAWLASGGLSKMRRTPKQKPVQAGKRAAGKGTESPGASGKRAR